MEKSHLKSHSCIKIRCVCGTWNGWDLYIIYVERMLYKKMLKNWNENDKIIYLFLLYTKGVLIFIFFRSISIYKIRTCIFSILIHTFPRSYILQCVCLIEGYMSFLYNICVCWFWQVLFAYIFHSSAGKYIRSGKSFSDLFFLCRV